MPKIPNTPAARVFRAVIVCAAGLSVLLIGCGGKVSTGPTGPAVATLTAVALDKEFTTNEPAAEGKYKDKVVIVTGKVKKITKDDKPGKITVELLGVYRKDMTPEQSTVDCHFSKSQSSELAALTVGSQVTIRGKCKGKINGWLTLDPCSLEANPPADTPGDKPADKPAENTISGRCAGATFTQSDGTLYLIVDGKERKIKIQGGARYFDKKGNQIKTKIVEKINKEDVVCTLTKEKGEDVVTEIRIKK
jgi:hypothetical protein